MGSRLVVVLLLLLSISSSFYSSVATADRGSSGGGGGANSLPCIQKLAPCQPYLRSPSPPVTCCAPLREIVEKDSSCLCAVFNNPDMLRSLNLTKDHALDLPKACGANADVSICKNSASPPSASPSTPSSPAAPNNDTSSSGNSTDGSAKKSSASTLIGFAELSFVSLIIVLIF